MALYGGYCQSEGRKTSRGIQCLSLHIYHNMVAGQKLSTRPLCPPSFSLTHAPIYPFARLLPGGTDTGILHAMPLLPTSGFSCEWMDRSLFSDRALIQWAPCDSQFFVSVLSQSLETSKKLGTWLPRTTFAGGWRDGQTNASTCCPSEESLGSMQCHFSEGLQRIRASWLTVITNSYWLFSTAHPLLTFSFPVPSLLESSP